MMVVFAQSDLPICLFVLVGVGLSGFSFVGFFNFCVLCFFCVAFGHETVQVVFYVDIRVIAQFLQYFFEFAMHDSITGH
jgi:hypothetical protein